MNTTVWVVCHCFIVFFLCTEPVFEHIVKNTFLNANKSSVDAFLAEYKASIEYIGNAENNESAAQMIVDAGVLPKLPVAKSALTNLYGSIVYQDGAEMKASLIGFYNAIDCALPSDEFYYGK